MFLSSSFLIVFLEYRLSLFLALSIPFWFENKQPSSFFLMEGYLIKTIKEK